LRDRNPRCRAGISHLDDRTMRKDLRSFPLNGAHDLQPTFTARALAV
jgi:hypothetical protein